MDNEAAMRFARDQIFQFEIKTILNIMRVMFHKLAVATGQLPRRRKNNAASHIAIKFILRIDD